MKRILVSAYAVNPFKGSEDGTGWNWVCQIARYQKPIVVTRANNQEPIEKFLDENPRSLGHQVVFLYYDLPYWARFWKKGGRGALLYFYLWQLFLPRFVRKSGVEFDIAHHLNFHNDWTPTFLWLFKKPLVWGPIGHHPKVPFAFLKRYGWKAVAKDRANWFIKLLFWHLDPFLKRTLKKADIILAVNSSEKQVHRKYKNKMIVVPAVASDNSTYQVASAKSSFKVLSVGRFVPLKGFDIAIRAFALFYATQPLTIRPQLKLTLVGKGPEKDHLKGLAKSVGVEHAIEWIEWVDKSEMEKIYQEADIFLFPSHEGAGMVIPEALSYKLPVLCFNNFGPGELTDDACAIRIPYASPTVCANLFSRAIHKLYHCPHIRKQMGNEAFGKWSRDLNWNVKGELLKRLYDKFPCDTENPLVKEDHLQKNNLVESEF